MAYDREGTLHALMAVLASSSAPIGTRSAQQALEEMGLNMSESSISRRLRELNERGWAISLGTKGRVISPAGREQLAEFEYSSPSKSPISRVVDVRSVQDVLDLLYARKAVESAAAASAATHATTEDIKALQALLKKHREALGTEQMATQPGLDLHRKIAAIAPNRMLKILTGLVLAPHLDRVEAVLDIVLCGHLHQSCVVDEHQKIVDAIVARDAKAAEQAVDEHFDSMIKAGEKSIVGDNASIITRLLSWMDAVSGPTGSSGSL
ncbi:FCD domain-containing protein [Salinicola sp. MIT1003]|uniref:FCD domain-containing protein n=1 Tax=Salinicola sp. MIT1003 TaxID=1882734 RepID=UPI0008DE785F|nr:FCD domain-containing protein [Salinicola sp. MIT1003]OHZ01627.1 hypothetical protein BC443_11405 [Salinicola sp. MIT1003]